MRIGFPSGGTGGPLHGCRQSRGSRHSSEWTRCVAGVCTGAARTGGGPDSWAGYHPQAAWNAGDRRLAHSMMCRKRDHEDVVGCRPGQCSQGSVWPGRDACRACVRRAAGSQLRAGVHGGRGSRVTSPASGSRHVSQSLVVRGSAGSIADERPAKARLSVAGRAQGGCGRGGPGRGGTRCRQPPATSCSTTTYSPAHEYDYVSGTHTRIRESTP